MNNDTPPGWYPVPGADCSPGHERWWDGNAWTSDVRPVRASPRRGPLGRTTPPRGPQDGEESAVLR
ncbi:DUF2510 domain-containing protein [Kitasatospora sp. NPDC101235]|uniref:DUF2510 domain-containing protein n=1 Tax=Kitasatospora sp. NPDC101235 TaxID=3364101 RepID=UPI00380F24B2